VYLLRPADQAGLLDLGMSVPFTELVETIGRGVDLAGVVVIAGGVVWITIVTLPRLRHQDRDDVYRDYRRGIGKAILLGLELLVAADIIRTVAVSPTIESVAVLGLIVLVRTFLSFSLEVELYGRWPWQRGGGHGARDLAR
jgi:uncharacterized membrane protein